MCFSIRFFVLFLLVRVGWLVTIHYNLSKKSSCSALLLGGAIMVVT